MQVVSSKHLLYYKSALFNLQLGIHLIQLMAHISDSCAKENNVKESTLHLIIYILYCNLNILLVTENRYHIHEDSCTFYTLHTSILRCKDAHWHNVV